MDLGERVKDPRVVWYSRERRRKVRLSADKQTGLIGGLRFERQDRTGQDRLPQLRIDIHMLCSFSFLHPA